MNTVSENTESSNALKPMLADVILELKEELALENGYTIKLPTYWDYAMSITNRKKEQLELYEKLILKVLQKVFENKIEVKNEQVFLIFNYMFNTREDYSSKEEMLIEFERQKSKAFLNNEELDIVGYLKICEFNNVD